MLRRGLIRPVPSQHDPPQHEPPEQELPLQDPTRIVVIAYLLALVCILVPLALVGGLFAGVALMRRNRPLYGTGVIVVAVACTAFGIVALR